LASNAAADMVAAVDAVTLVDVAGPDDNNVTVEAAGVTGWELLNSCAFSCSLKFLGFDADRLGE